MLGLARFVTHSSGGSGPSLNFNFADNSPYLSQQITFTRASAGTFVGSNGLIQNAPVNLFTYSEQFDNAAWVKINTTIVANSTNAPDGAVAADTATTTSTADGVSRDLTALTANATYTLSFYIKNASATWLRLVMYESAASTNRFSGWFNATTGVAGSATNGGTGTGAAISVVNVGNGWYRVALSGAVNNSATACTVQISTAIANGSTTGVNAVSYYLWGAQLVEASVAGPYARTVASTSGAPRFDYDPVTLDAKGLLIEEQRTNGFLYSQDFTNAYWNYSNAVTITANVTTAPDGTITGNLVVPNAGTVNARTGRNPAGTGGVNRTYSFYVKANGIQYITINTSNTLSYGTCFDIVNGTKIDPTVGVVGASTITNAGNGWWRITHPTATGTIPTILPGTTFVRKGSADTDTFNGTDGFYIWGAQWEDTFTFPTSYIPTVASQVTRSADVASVNTLSPWFNASSGSFYAEADITGAPASNRMLEVHDGTDNNRLILQTVNSSSSARFSGVAAGVLTEASTTSSPISGVPFKAAGAFTAGEYVVCYNGGTVGTAAPAALPTGLSAMVLGARRSGAQVLNGHLRRVTFYPRRLSNATLQQITS